MCLPAAGFCLRLDELGDFLVLGTLAISGGNTLFLNRMRAPESGIRNWCNTLFCSPISVRLTSYINSGSRVINQSSFLALVVPPRLSVCLAFDRQCELGLLRPFPLRSMRSGQV